MQKKWWKKYSAYQIATFFLLIAAVIGVLVTIPILANLKTKKDNAKRKKDELKDILKDLDPPAETEWQRLYIEKINDFKL